MQSRATNMTKLLTSLFEVRSQAAAGFTGGDLDDLSDPLSAGLPGNCFREILRFFRNFCGKISDSCGIRRI